MADTTAPDDADHTDVDMLLGMVDKKVRQNPAMSVGEFWRFHLAPVVKALHKFHIDYTDDNAGGEDEFDPDYVHELLDFVHDAKVVDEKQTDVLMMAFKKLGYVDAKGDFDPAKIPEDMRGQYEECRDALLAWMTKYPELVQEQVADPADAGAPEDQEPAQDGAS